MKHHTPTHVRRRHTPTVPQVRRHPTNKNAGVAHHTTRYVRHHTTHHMATRHHTTSHMQGLVKLRGTGKQGNQESIPTPLYIYLNPQNHPTSPVLKRNTWHTGTKRHHTTSRPSKHNHSPSRRWTNNSKLLVFFVIVTYKIILKWIKLFDIQLSY